MKRERNRNDSIGNIGLSFKDIKNSKKITLKFIIFLLIFCITTVPSLAILPHGNLSVIPENKTCADCHTPHQSMNIPPESSTISIANPPLVSKSNDIQSLTATDVAITNVIGNITLISSLGQNWYQQGIYGPNTSNDNSWGWTFFDENPPSGFMTPNESVTQRENIYALLLDDGNNSNPISGATVVANVTYWTWDNVSYSNHTVQVQLSEDTNRKGFYSGRFDFYGGTSYAGYGMGNCDGCHSSLYGFSDTQIGYFPGNYTVSIRAEADGNIKYTNLDFEVTPWGCEDCHGSGNQHRASADMDSACYICHGINTFSGMSGAGNPHQNSAHKGIECQECHTNKTLSSQAFTNVTFGSGGIGNRSVPIYNNITTQLNRGTHSNLTCTYCHNGLTLPIQDGSYKEDNYTIKNTVNNYTPGFASLEQFEDYYVINVTSSSYPLNINLDWNSTANLGFYLYPPDFNPKGSVNVPLLYDGATPLLYYDSENYIYYYGPTIKPEIFIDNNPKVGQWILQVHGYDLRIDGPLNLMIGINSSYGVLQPPINYTINSTYPIRKKDLPSTSECNSCHNQNGAGNASTTDIIPDWNPGFAHVDTNGDGTLDIQCRMCHDSMHEITVKNCHNCHTIATVNHPIKEPEFANYTPPQCLNCHGDPHKITSAGGTDCIACHSQKDVNISLFGRHADINTSDVDGNVTNNDCWTCHYQQDMDRSHIYLCESCHLNNSGIARVNDSSLIKGDFMHGMTTCKVCHAPVGYHQKGTVGPLGLVERILAKNG